MSVDGIWKVEMLGPYGWEAVSTAFFENGRYLAASQDHYAVGSYELTGNNVRVTASMYSHGQIRTLFGANAPQVELKFGGEINDSGDHISGQAEDEQAKYSVTFRAMRLAISAEPGRHRKPVSYLGGCESSSNKGSLPQWHLLKPKPSSLRAKRSNLFG